MISSYLMQPSALTQDKPRCSFDRFRNSKKCRNNRCCFLYLLVLQSHQSPSLRLSCPQSVQRTCGSSWTPTPSTGTDPSFKGKWSIVRRVGAGTTYSLWTPRATRSGTWILTQSTKSASCWQDQAKEEPDLPAQRSRRGRSVLVSTRKGPDSCKHHLRDENVSHFPGRLQGLGLSSCKGEPSALTSYDGLRTSHRCHCRLAVKSYLCVPSRGRCRALGRCTIFTLR